MTRDANNTESAFLANMSHEIRTPLSALLELAEAMRDPSISEEERADCLDSIERNGRRLLALLNDVCDFSCLESGTMALESGPTSLGSFGSDLVKSFASRATDKGIDLVLTWENGQPKPEPVVLDALRLRQILVNLLDNAIKFTHEGSVHLRVHDDAVRSVLTFEVEDTGIGIRPAKHREIFQAFREGGPRRKTPMHGTGLGLALSSKLAALMNGTLAVSSDLRQGAIFRLELPYALVRQGGAPSAVSAERPYEPRPGRVLLVEDSPELARLTRRRLERLGLTVEVASNGLEATSLALRGRGDNVYDLIFMDMQIPIQDGYEAAAELRAGGGYEGPIVAMTAFAMAEDRQRCLDAGCTDYLPKPVDDDQLMAMLERYLPPASTP